MKCFTVSNDKDIEDEVEDESIKNCKKDLEKIKRMIVNEEDGDKII